MSGMTREETIKLEKGIAIAVAEVRTIRNMGRCERCQHWRWIRDEDHSARAYFADPHDTREYVWPGPHGECLLVHDTSYTETFDSQSAWVHGVYYLPDLSLITKPEFGCVLFEERAG